MNLITDKQAKSNIVSIKANGVKMDALIHETGVFAVAQANLHGNTTVMNQLVGALNKSARKEALVTWFRDHAKVAQLKTGLLEYRKDRKLYNTVPMQDKAEVTIEQAIENANNIPFWAYTKEAKPVSSYDVLSRLESLLNSAKNFKGEVKHQELLNTLATIVEASKAGDTIELTETLGEALL